MSTHIQTAVLVVSHVTAHYVVIVWQGVVMGAFDKSICHWFIWLGNCAAKSIGWTFLSFITSCC